MNRQMKEILQPLRLPGFARLAATYTVNELADWLATIALTVLVFDLTGDPLATTALVLASKVLPGLLVPAVAARLDGLPSSRVLGGLYATEAVALAALAVTASAPVLVLVLVLALAEGTLAATARAVTRSTTVALLESRDALREGNSLLNIGFSAMCAGGPAIAGLLVAGLGAGAVLGVSAGAFAVLSVGIATAPGLPRGEIEPAPWASRLREGLDYVRSDPRLVTLLGGQAVVLLLLTMATPIEVVYAKETLDAGDAGLGALLAAWGSGMVVGSAVFAAQRRRALSTLIVASTLAMALGYVGMALAPALLAACLASALGGLGNGVQWVAVVTALQEHTQERFQARVAGLLEAVMAAAPGAGFLLGGIIAASLSPRVAFAVSGGGVLLVLAAGGAILARRRAGLDPDAEPAPAR